MTRQVKGFLANDGTFFESKSEALRYDSENVIKSWCESHKIEPAKVLDIIHAIGYEIKDYIFHDQSCENPRVDDPRPIAASQAHSPNDW